MSTTRSFRPTLPISRALQAGKSHVATHICNGLFVLTIPALRCRLDFTHRSIRYLFRTTYDRGDDLTIASLVTYLNAAIPADKHEEFDTTEVTKAATALHERGDISFQGDVVRMLDD